MLSAAELSVSYLASLRQRGARDAAGRCYIEGVRFVARALAQGFEFEALVVAPALLQSPVGQSLVKRLRRTVPVLTVTAEELAALSLQREPQGLAAVVRQRWGHAGALANPRRDALWLCVERLRSPGNLGSLLRTCDAVGASGLIVTSPEVDPYEPTAIRATMGSLFEHPLLRLTARELRQVNRHGDYFIVGAGAEGERDFRSVSYRRPVILVLGDEREGLSGRQRALCDAVVRIPMRGACDSLNVAVAGGLLLYEAYGQRAPARK